MSLRLTDDLIPEVFGLMEDLGGPVAYLLPRILGSDLGLMANLFGALLGVVPGASRRVCGLVIGLFRPLRGLMGRRLSGMAGISSSIMQVMPDSLGKRRGRKGHRTGKDQAMKLSNTHRSSSPVHLMKYDTQNRP